MFSVRYLLLSMFWSFCLIQASAWAIPMQNPDLRKEFQIIYQDLLEDTGGGSWSFDTWEAGFLTRESVGLMRRFKSSYYYVGVGPAFNPKLESGLISALGLEYSFAPKWLLNTEISSTRAPMAWWENEASVSAVYIF